MLKERTSISRLLAGSTKKIVRVEARGGQEPENEAETSCAAEREKERRIASSYILLYSHRIV